MRLPAPLIILLPLLCPTLLFAQSTERVSLDSNGVQGNQNSEYSAISADARFVAFDSMASNLVVGDTNATSDVFLHDRLTGETTRVSVDSSGVEGDQSSEFAAISADGRYVAFASLATNLVPNDTNANWDVFVHDTLTGVTSRVSVDSSGLEATGVTGSFYPAISADGRFIAFASNAWNLVANDSNNSLDVFVHDQLTGETTRVSVDSAGFQGNFFSSEPSISANGRFVAFESWSWNLVPNDNNGAGDVFLHDRLSGATTRVSVDSTGIEGNQASTAGALSADGQVIAFESKADNLVAADTNSQDDIFVHDLNTGQTTRVSVGNGNVEGNSFSYLPSISADGQIVCFDSRADNLVPNDLNGNFDVFLHDLETGLTTVVSVDPSGVVSDFYSYGSSMSADGRFISFTSASSNLVAGDTGWLRDIFVRDRGFGAELNTIILTAPYLAAVGNSLELKWFNAPPLSKYWLVYSLNLNGTVVAGHTFDLGSPNTILSNGTTTADGSGIYSSAPVPSGAAGLTVYFELAVRDGNGVFWDSIVLPVAFE
ncbi:MAG: PD40 domain-containing protein [Planctomycetes bacterium]|nr:PD40 domain-containing protein [Planctomycetota bacterium]